MTAGGAEPAGGTDILVLGTVVVRHRGELITPPSRGGRILLGNLGLDCGRGLRDDTLLRRMWPCSGEEDAKRALRVAVHRLRHWLHEAVGDAVAVRRTSQGYVLDLPTGHVDADRFRALVAKSGPLPPEDKAELLAEALELWRGPALVDVPSEHVDGAELHQLTQQRTIATIDYARSMVHCGNADAALRALTPFVADDSLNEGVHAAWIEALAVSGQQAAALEAYETLRVRLRDEFGIEPSRELSRTLMKVLHQDLPEPAGPPPPVPAQDDRPAPAQLPAGVHAFTGREDYLRELDELLTDSGDGAATMVISAISGAGGVGKTALAVYWAHRVASRYPDGQLYLDLRGFSKDEPVAPVNALGRLLRAIGVPDGSIPPDESEAAGLFRSMVANKRMLILLDNAATAEQVRPLIPGTPGSLVLVTSRAQLSGLVAIDGARRVVLETMSVAESVDLLTTLLGRTKVAAEPEAVTDLASACACLPLALRIAGANLLGHRSQRIADFVAQLRGGSRWRALTVAGDDRATVRLAFDLSYRHQSEAARQVFRLLGLMPGADSSAAAICASSDMPEHETLAALGELVEAHLLREDDTGRYSFHDLLRAYARDLADQDAAAAGDAWRRLARWYLATADNAVRQLHPKVLRLAVPPVQDSLEFDDDATATAWLSDELANLVAITRQAVSHGTPNVAWLLGDALRIYLFRRRLNVEFDQVVGAALTAATDAGDAGGCAAAELALATACRSHGDLPNALHHLHLALGHSRRAEWTECEVATLSNIAVIHTEMGELDRATRYLREVQELNRTLGDLAREATAFNNLGAIQFESGHLDEAICSFQQALAKYHEVGDDSYDGLTLHSLGRALRDRGRLDAARETLDRALSTAHATGDKHIEAGIMSDLARMAVDLDDLDAAKDNAWRALVLARDVDDQFEQIAALICLAGADARLGDLDAALAGFERARALALETNQAGPAAESLIGLGFVRYLRGDHELAATHAREALARSHECGFRLLEGRALQLLAEIHRTAGRHDRARTLAERAVATHAATGYQIGEARAARTLRDVHRATGDEDAAAVADRSATAILTRIGAPIR